MDHVEQEYNPRITRFFIDGGHIVGDGAGIGQNILAVFVQPVHQSRVRKIVFAHTDLALVHRIQLWVTDSPLPPYGVGFPIQRWEGLTNGTPLIIDLPPETQCRYDNRLSPTAKYWVLHLPNTVGAVVNNAGAVYFNGSLLVEETH